MSVSQGVKGVPSDNVGIKKLKYYISSMYRDAVWERLQMSDK